MDVGGGSTEVVSFQDCQMHNVYSISSGSLSLFRTYVSEILPNEKQQKIIEAMLRELKEKIQTKNTHQKTMLAAGGSARACAALLKGFAYD